MLTQEYLKSILDYNEETGIFTWKIRPNGRVPENSIAGTLTSTGYIGIGIHKKHYQAHRLAWLYVYGKFPLLNIDHKNGIRVDNRLLNLREATKSQNGMNSKTPSNNTSGYRGVSYHKVSKKWIASSRILGIRQNLGYFDNPEEAHRAYQDFIKIHHKDFYQAS